MLKTEQARTSRYTSRVDKPVDRTISVGSKRKPQYLDVALARGNNDLNLKESKDVNKSGKGKNVKVEKEDLGIKRGKNKVNVFTGKNVNTSDQKLSTTGNKTARQQPQGSEISADKSLTFKDKLSFENDRNQRLYQELDEMLAGKHGMSFQSEPKHEEPSVPVKVTKRELARKEPVTVLTKQSLYPGITKEARERHNDNLSFRESNVPPKSFLGEESEILHKRELQAEARLEKLENIDRFTVGDFTVKPQGPSSQLTNRTQTVSVGIPVHGGNAVSRRHIVADIPVYLPTYAGGNQPVQPVIKETGPVPVDEVYKNTIPGSLGKPFQAGAHPTSHAPEAFVGPVLGLDTVIAETQGGPPVLNTYRITGNPISERLLKEKEKHEQSVLENKYFDVDPESKETNKAQQSYIRNIKESDDRNTSGTLVSDPGPRLQDNLVGEKLRLSPEGYLARKAREERLEKEENSFRKAERREAFVTQEPSSQKSSKAVPKFDNQYQLDFYAQRTRSDIRLGMNLDREDSWIKRQLEKPTRSPAAMDTYRGQGGTYRPGGYRNEPQRGGEDTYRAGGQLTYRADGETTYKSNDSERFSNRSYNLPDNIRGRDRYSDQGGERYSDQMARGPGNVSNRDYDPRYEREKRDFTRERDSRRDFDERNRRDFRNSEMERDRRDFDERSRRERDYRSSEMEKDRREFDERSRKEKDYRNSEIERDRKDFERMGKYERGPLSSMYEPDRERDRFNESLRDIKPNLGKPAEKDSYGRQTVDKSNSKEGKVQYVLRNKSEHSRNELRKSDMSERSEPLPESIPPSSTELVSIDRSPKSQYSRKSNETEVPNRRSSPPAYSRQTPLGQEKSKGSMNEHKETLGRLPTYETKLESKAGGKSADDLNNYFDNPERHESPASVMPHYSDGNDTYTRPKHDFRNGEMMTPVQEMSVKQSEEDDGQQSKTDKGSAGSKPVSDKNERVKFLSSNSNKHEIAEDRRSPWRKTDNVNERQRSPSLREEPPSRIERQTESPDISKIKGPDSVQQMRERIREKTLEKMKEKREERRRERTIDSQGPTDNKDDFKTDEIDIDDLNLDDVETEMDEKELYVCYLVTDSGEKIGPMRLDINDVQVGLPYPDKVKDIPEQTGEIENEGMRNRQTGSHGLNEFSSRSHSMLMLTIDSEMQDPEDENLFITKRGKLTFVDLAGSEKVKDSNSTADTLVESNSINKSLLVLGNCISSLGDQKRRQGHIPYRDSKLTKLLADSLGGNGVTLMICCITPSSYHAPETMNTLRYASRAKKIRTKPVIKMDPREKLILSLKREIKVLRNENHYLRQQTGVPTKLKPKPSNEEKPPTEKKPLDSENIVKPGDVIKNYKGKNKENLEFPAKPKNQLQKENDHKMMKIMKETNGKPDTNNTVSNHDEKAKQGGNGADESGLYEMLQEYMVENEALRTENAEMQVNRDKVRQDQQLLYRDNEKLMKRVDELERRLNQATTSWQSMPRQDSHRSRDQSPRNSPQYRGGGSGGKVMQAKFVQPPNELRDIPALRDPIYPGSPPQGYHSPTSNGRPKPGQGQQPPPQRGQPLKPPHRLADPIPQQRPPYEQNGPPYMNGNPGSYPAGHQAMQPGPGHHPGTGNQYRQPHVGSPNRPNDLRMDSRKSSSSSSSDAIRDMNEKLKQELAQLDGQIHHHHSYNQHKSNYGSQGSMR